MKVTFWGTRGSIPTPGKSRERYGGNTSCVEVRGSNGELLVLDAGTGIRALGNAVAADVRRIDLLLTHFHMDHIQGLGFFAPFYIPGMEIHIWAPPSTTRSLSDSLALYLSPPLFPINLEDLNCDLILHSVPLEGFKIGPFRIETAFICHPGPTVGYRILENNSSIAYMPDHEPALGCRKFPDVPAWTSGLELAKNVDMLIHDTQYTEAEYLDHVGWGHSSMEQALAFAKVAEVKRLIFFHHNPSHSDEEIDRNIINARAMGLPFTIDGAVEGGSFEV